MKTLISLSFVFLLSCSATPSGGNSGEGLDGGLKDGEGASFTQNKLTSPGNFKNSDIYAVENGPEGLKLISGGPNSTEPSPVNWFKSGGKAQTFGSLAEVPNTKPSDTDTTSLPHAKTGNGFVVKNNMGFGHTRGWISYADAETVIIEYSHLD